jgi:predicted hydrocarbon binding protein
MPEDCNNFTPRRNRRLHWTHKLKMASTVHARIPLSLLEAIRRIDTPEDQVDAEYVPELRNKRLGLSDTVYTQIRRYSEATKRGQKIPFAEASGLGTLIGRRPDSDDLFLSAGRILADDIYRSIAAPKRSMIGFMPGFIARPLALKELQSIAVNFFGGTVTRSGSFVELQIPDSVTVNGAPKSAGCVFYESAFRELLHLLVKGGEQVDHIHCVQRNDGACEWRAEWRSNH